MLNKGIFRGNVGICFKDRGNQFELQGPQYNLGIATRPGTYSFRD